MHDHNLDDLIIDNINPKNTKTKSFLTIIALAIIVLIVAIILTKLVLKRPHNDLLLKEGSTEMISPDLMLTQVEEDHVKKPTTSEPVTTKPSIVTPKVVTPKVTEIKVKETKVRKVVAQIPETIKPEIKPIEAETPLVSVSDLFNEKNGIHVKNPIVNIPTIEENNNRYYIQVGSFTKTPSQRFLSIIRKSGFNYNITAASENGIKKLLIGPYENKSNIEAILKQVKDRINKSAFVIKK